MQQYSPFEIIMFGLILINVILSMMAFGNYRRFEQLKFNVGAILNNKEYYRMISSSFIHGGWLHLIMNMYVMYMFSNVLSLFVSIPSFLIIFFVSMIISHLVSLLVHRKNSIYSAVGASGAVSGLVYASIYFAPKALNIWFMPGWLFGVLYMIYSIYASKKINDNIGHDAHIGGAISGLILAFLLDPRYAFTHIEIIGILFIPVLYYLYTLFNGNNLLSQFKRLDPQEKGNYSNRSIDDLYNQKRTLKIRELNELLDLVKEKGYEGLSYDEKKRLDELSKELE